MQSLDEQSCAGPHAASSWVLPGKLIAGGYPGSRDEEEHEAIVEAILQSGVTTFVCLQTLDELLRFRAYGPTARRMRPSVKILHAPINDLSVTSDAAARSAADTILRQRTAVSLELTRPLAASSPARVRLSSLQLSAVRLSTCTAGVATGAPAL